MIYITKKLCISNCKAIATLLKTCPLSSASFSVASFRDKEFFHNGNIQHAKKPAETVYGKHEKEKGSKEHKHSCLASGLFVYPT